MVTAIRHTFQQSDAGTLTTGNIVTDMCDALSTIAVGGSSSLSLATSVVLHSWTLKP